MKAAAHQSAVLVVVALAAFAAGTWLGGKRAPAPLALAPAPTARPDEPAGPAHFQSLEAAYGAVVSTLHDPEPLSRCHTLRAVLEQVTAEQAPALLDRLDLLPRRHGCNDLLALVFTRLCRRFPAVTAEWLLRQRQDLNHYSGACRDHAALFMAWAHYQPEAALVEARKNPDFFGEIFASNIHAPGSDAASRRAAFERLPRGPLRESAAARSVEFLAFSDPPEALRLIESELHGEARVKALLPGIEHRFWKIELEPALKLVAQAAPDIRGGLWGHPALNEFTAKAARRSAPQRVAEWTQTLPEPLRRHAALEAVLEWMATAPVAALDRARAHGVPVDRPNPNSRHWRKGGGTPLELIVQTAPEKAGAWLRSLPPGPERDGLFASAISMTRDRAELRAALGP